MNVFFWSMDLKILGGGWESAILKINYGFNIH